MEFEAVEHAVTSDKLWSMCSLSPCLYVHFQIDMCTPTPLAMHTQRSIAVKSSMHSVCLHRSPNLRGRSGGDVVVDHLSSSVCLLPFEQVHPKLWRVEWPVPVVQRGVDVVEEVPNYKFCQSAIESRLPKGCWEY